jgi:hypothetical protein
MVNSQRKLPEKTIRSRWSGIIITAALFGFGILCQLPILSEMLSGILNGLLYLFFPRDHMLLGYVSIVRRLILLIGIMAAAGIAGKALGGRWGGWAAMAVTAIARPVTTILMVTADSLYAALAGLSFAVLISGWIAEKRSGGRMGIAPWIGIGLLLGFAALARMDGLIIGLALIPVLWFFRGRGRASAREALIFASGFILPVAVYLLAYGIVSGTWDPQIGQRSYLAFEQGHNFLYTDRYEVIPSPSSAELYGTAEENGNSVLRAIARNPKAFLSRLPRTAANAVRMFYDAYSILGGAMFLFLAAGGALALWKEGRRAVFGLALLWCLPLAGYALASYRPGFFGMLFPVLLALVVAGAVPVAAHSRALMKSEQSPLLAVWSLVAVSMLGAQLAFAAGQFRGWNAKRQAQEQYRTWLMELSDQVPRGQCIISYSAAEAIYSNHEVYDYWQLFYEAGDPDALRKAMAEAGCRYLVVDDDLRGLAPDFVPIAESALSPVYTSRDGSRTIYELTP